jgi:TetR/AcrR family transcriptional repressor of bet genes
LIDKSKMTKRSFIEEARRAQIIEATIETLAEVGYVKASMAQIAKRAGISTSLIPYHFKDKDELITHTLIELSTAWIKYVQERTDAGASAATKLRLYIEANLAYMGTRPAYFMALMEIVFNVRDAEDRLVYVTSEDDPSVIHLENLLKEGQANGEFRPFDVVSMAIAIRGTIDGFLGQLPKSSRQLETFTAETTTLFDIATRHLPDKEVN